VGPHARRAIIEEASQVGRGAPEAVFQECVARWVAALTLQAATVRRQFLPKDSGPYRGAEPGTVVLGLSMDWAVDNPKVLFDLLLEVQRFVDGTCGY
jgi:hypothetical protein